MPKQQILDSHIHLWPASAANPQSHAWMQSGAHLTKQYSIQDYISASSSGSTTHELRGFVYVETDRFIDRDEDKKEDIRQWAAEPLRELAFLRRIIEGKPEKGENFDDSSSHLLKGVVAWAPLDRGLDVFEEYTTIAEEVIRPQRINGFRFLLQGIRDKPHFEQVVMDAGFIGSLKLMGSRGWSFDVGVDQRQGGNWQLEMIPDVITRVHEGANDANRTIFVLNHLCKPDMEQTPTSTEKKADFEQWKASISRLAALEHVYMKLSGCFSEIADQDPSQPWPIAKLLERTQPWLDHIFSHFSPQRIMFGSDWPVCNVRGPGDNLAWRHWRDFVEAVLGQRGLSDKEKDSIWFGTAVEAYRLNKDKI